MSEIKVWKEGSTGEPKFGKFEVLKKAVLQATDLKTNKNKYYAIELHSDKKTYRVYTHYGRTDDLESNPDAGMRECRYCSNLIDAESLYDKIYKQKTSKTKGYKEINLASTKIGSKQSMGKSSGIVDDKTLKKIAGNKDKDIKVVSTISPPVQKLVANLYSEATKALVKVANVNITGSGIETPLGVLTLGQIEDGQNVLDQLSVLVSSKQKNKDDAYEELSGQFYTLIPHRIGRNWRQAKDVIINSKDKVEEKNDTLQLMRDMLNINKNNVLVNPDIEKKYQALGCEISFISPSDAKFAEIQSYVKKSRADSWESYKIKNLYVVKRPIEQKNFNDSIGNKKLLFHGSNAKNWVGILSRGFLLPKKVTKLGVQRTDAGWLGHGIYFGNAVGTAYNYAGQTKQNTKYIALAMVALGKIKVYKNITYGLTEPPKGFDSCHGNPSGYSEFADHEFVIYDEKQQKLEYLIELG